MLRKCSLIAVFASYALLSACATVPMASDGSDSTAKSFATTPGKANIYVYRNESLGMAIKHPITLDGRMVGDTAAKTYFLLPVNPGKHTIVSLTDSDNPLAIDAQSGRNYFVWLQMKMGMFAPRSNLQLVDEAEGRKGVMECKLIQLGGQ
ncbi:MAG TPA: DUF2846 domain-containing protein [Burkholderiales bacterium]|nr:DUF2846 domain-containing protein [Burkholderiales bacterium]